MQRQKQHALPPDIQAVAKALRKKEGGADEALRLVEHLQDKEALELLLEGARVSRQRFTPLLLILYALGSFFMLSAIADKFLFWDLSGKQPVLLSILSMSLMIVASSLGFGKYRTCEDRNRDQAISQHARNIRHTNALDSLLRYCAQPFIPQELRENCWKTIALLLPKIPDDEAQALSSEARAFLHDTIEETRPHLPNSSAGDKIAALLVLASVKDEKTKRLMENQLVRPALKAAAESILEDW
jgi:hypothetical protein